jgi:ABC-type multidrug transport system ATPase subunit
VLLTTQYLDEADHFASQIVIIDHGCAVELLGRQGNGERRSTNPRDA